MRRPYQAKKWSLYVFCDRDYLSIFMKESAIFRLIIVIATIVATVASFMCWLSLSSPPLLD